MQTTKDTTQEKPDSGKWDQLRLELEDLDTKQVEIEGIKVKPSQCYRITNNSLQVIYNTNCPDHLKDKIAAILEKYTAQSENYPPEQEFFFP